MKFEELSYIDTFGNYNYTESILVNEVIWFHRHALQNGTNKSVLIVGLISVQLGFIRTCIVAEI